MPLVDRKRRGARESLVAAVSIIERDISPPLFRTICEIKAHRNEIGKPSNA
jgi:hypothetical protein